MLCLLTFFGIILCYPVLYSTLLSCVGVFAVFLLMYYAALLSCAVLSLFPWYSVILCCTSEMYSTLISSSVVFVLLACAVRPIFLLYCTLFCYFDLNPTFHRISMFYSILLSSLVIQFCVILIYNLFFLCENSMLYNQNRIRLQPRVCTTGFETICFYEMWIVRVY